MQSEDMIFNRVLGLKFLYDNFPHLFNEERIKLFFVNSRDEILNMEFPDKHFDTIVLKRSGDNKSGFISDITCKDNRFFSNYQELKDGILEFEDEFIYCVECHKFKKGESYYSDKLAIAQFSTESDGLSVDRINFIPSQNPGVSTRDNQPYLVIEFPYNMESIFRVFRTNESMIKANNLSDYDIYYLLQKMFRTLDAIREYLCEVKCENVFQLIIRIDSYLNILPIDFRTPEAWAKTKVLSRNGKR